MTLGRLEFGVSQYTTPSLEFAQDIDLLCKLGVASIELAEVKLSRDPDVASRDLLASRASGLAVATVQPRVHALYPDSQCESIADPQTRMSHYLASLDLFADALGDGLTFVTVAGRAPGFNYRQAWATATGLYRELADEAAARGARIAFEPLNPIFMNTDTFICSLAEASKLVEAVDRPNFGVLVDVWHVWHEPDLLPRLHALGERIFGVHISDWPRGGPRCQADRELPGRGLIDLAAVLGALGEAGYGGPCSLEIFSLEGLEGSLWRLEPAQLIEESRAGFLRALEDAA